MGLSIHYNGKFRDGADLSAMIDEIKEIAEILNWDYHVYNREFPEKEHREISEMEIYGIEVIPQKCEPVSFCFLPNRRLSAKHLLMFWGKTDEGMENKFLYLLSTKTQYAGIEVHKAIILLFKHLVKSNYFENFEMIDEGEYWETGDEKILEENFKRYNALIDNFTLAIESTGMNENETIEDFITRIAKMINKKRKK